jgi:hypothetical protein
MPAGQKQLMSAWYRLTQGTEQEQIVFRTNTRRRLVDRQTVRREHVKHRLVSVSAML